MCVSSRAIDTVRMLFAKDLKMHHRNRGSRRNRLAFGPPELYLLENRTLLSTGPVLNVTTAGSGLGSLQAEINQAAAITTTGVVVTVQIPAGFTINLDNSIEIPPSVDPIDVV